MRTLKIASGIVVLILAAMACSLPGGSAPNETTPAVDGNVSPPDSESVEEPTQEIIDSASDSNLFLPLDPEQELELLTPEAGNGSHPLFEWEAVAGADLYMLFVFDGENGAYWAWEGDQTQIYLGGFHEEPPSDIDGPVLLEPMTWAVIAATEDGEYVGSSVVKTIAP